MRRREFITLTSGAMAWPLAARAQLPAGPLIGFLSSRSHQDSKRVVAAWLEGLGETGYVEGRNLTVEYRWAEGQYSRLPTLIADLIGLRVATRRREAAGRSGLGTVLPLLRSSFDQPTPLFVFGPVDLAAREALRKNFERGGIAMWSANPLNYPNDDGDKTHKAEQQSKWANDHASLNSSLS